MMYPTRLNAQNVYVPDVKDKGTLVNPSDFEFFRIRYEPFMEFPEEDF